MKENKGFTLVELLGIVAIIAVIIVFVAPSIIGIQKRDEEKEYDRFVDDLSLATESYVNNNLENYPNLSVAGGTYTITLQELIDNNYIKSNTVNPRTKERIKGTDTMQITKKTDGTYGYQYQAR